MIVSERAAANGKIRKLLPKIQEQLERAGINIQGKEYAVEIDIYGKLEVIGDFSEKEKQVMAKILEEEFKDKMWDYHMQASNYTAAEFDRINAYQELFGFLEKSTGNQYSWKDIFVDENGKIQGLPKKMCRLLNSQESNGRYEQLRDNIRMLYDYGREYGMKALSDYKVRYEIADSTIRITSNR